MGVGISLGNLAGTVAKNGAMGVISMADVGYLEDDFNKNPMQANKRGFKKEVEKARNLAQSNGIIAVNIMRALSNFEEYVKIMDISARFIANRVSFKLKFDRIHTITNALKNII